MTGVLTATDTSRAILQTAREHFAGKGFDDTSIAELAGDLHFTKGAVFHHFGSKANLFAAVHAVALAEASTIPFPTGLEPKEALLQILPRFTMGLAAPDSFRILVVDGPTQGFRLPKPLWLDLLVGAACRGVGAITTPACATSVLAGACVGAAEFIAQSDDRDEAVSQSRRSVSAAIVALFPR